MGNLCIAAKVLLYTKAVLDEKQKALAPGHRIP
jgi:hypothetical protein